MTSFFLPLTVFIEVKRWDKSMMRDVIHVHTLGHFLTSRLMTRVEAMLLDVSSVITPPSRWSTFYPVKEELWGVSSCSVIQNWSLERETCPTDRSHISANSPNICFCFSLEDIQTVWWTTEGAPVHHDIVHLITCLTDGSWEGWSVWIHTHTSPWILLI